MGAIYSANDVKLKLNKVHSATIKLDGPYCGRMTQNTGFKCENKHTWQAPAYRVLNGHGCPECKKETLRLKHKLSEKEIKKRLKGRYFEPLEPYHNIVRKIRFLCLICKNTCKISFNSAMHRKHGCPTCANNARRITGGYSLAAIKWMNTIAKKLRLKFKHLENGGEHKIDLGFTYITSVDGYNTSKRIVLEFDGDYWHKRNDKRSREYKRTVKRTNELLKLGYVVIHVWEKDFDKGELGTMFNPCRKQFRKLAKKLGLAYASTKRIEEI